MVIVRPSHFLQEKDKAKAIHMLCLMAVGGQPRERKLTDRCSNPLQPISMMRQIWMASFVAKCVSVICHVERVDGKAHCWGRNGSRSCRGLTGPVTGPAMNERNMRKYNSPSASKKRKTVRATRPPSFSNNTCRGGSCHREPRGLPQELLPWPRPDRNTFEARIRSRKTLAWAWWFLRRDRHREFQLFLPTSHQICLLCVWRTWLLANLLARSPEGVKLASCLRLRLQLARVAGDFFTAASAVPDRPCWSTLPAKPCSQNLQRPMQICLHPQSQRAEVRCHCHLARGAWPLSCPACNSARVAYWKARFWLQLFQPHGSPTLWKFYALIYGLLHDL